MPDLSQTATSPDGALPLHLRSTGLKKDGRVNEGIIVIWVRTLRPDPDSGSVESFRWFRYSARDRQQRSRYRRTPFDPCPALRGRNKSVGRAGMASDWPSRSVIRLIDDSDFGVGELRCAGGFGPGRRT